jgi:hypothetical protein
MARVTSNQYKRKRGQQNRMNQLASNPTAEDGDVATISLARPSSHATRKRRSTGTARAKRLKYVWQLEERWDLAMVDKLLAMLPPDHRDRAVLRHVKAHTGSGGVHHTNYHHSKNRSSGRLYASDSMQRVTCQIRDLCTHKSHSDIDANNCFPELLLQVLNRQGIEAPELGKYNANREKILLRLQREHPSITRREAKKAFLVVLHNGAHRSVTGSQWVAPVLADFQADIQRATATLYHVEAYREVRAHVERQGKRNLLGSFISLVCQDLEEGAIDAARRYLEDTAGITVRVNMFDGLLTDVIDPERMADILEGCTAAAFAATGYRLEFVQKPIRPPNLEEVCPRLAVTTTSKVVLFSLEGTLTCGDALRPGAEQCLQVLHRQGITTGLFTCQPKHRIRPEWVALGFDLILTAEHCYATGEWKKTDDSKKRTKSLSWHFPTNAHVVINDDKPHCVADRDRSMVVQVSTWTGDPNDVELPMAIQRATSEVLRSRMLLSTSSTLGSKTEAMARVDKFASTLDSNHRTRRVREVQTSCEYMGEDPVFDARTEQGSKLLGEWGKAVLYRGRIGSGKTWCLNNAVVQYMQANPLKRIVWVVPFTQLARAQATNIRTALAADAGTVTVRVHMYKDPPLPPDAEWDVLITCAMSLCNFRFTGIGLVVLDELSAIGAQLAGWISEDPVLSRRLEQSIDIIAAIASSANATLVLAGAQADAFAVERVLALLNIKPDVDILVYRHVEPGPEIPVVRLQSTAHAVNVVQHHCAQGRRVAVHVRHARDAEHLAEYLRRKSGDENACVLLWTHASVEACKMNPHPSANITEYLQALRPSAIVYTTALSPGMGVDADLFDCRVMIEGDSGSGAPAKVLAQMPGRMRKMKDLTIALYAPAAGAYKSSDAGDQIMSQLVTHGCADVHTRLSADGTPECVLKPGLRNDCKLEAVMHSERSVTFEDILPHIGNTREVPMPSDLECVSTEPDPLWTQICKRGDGDVDLDKVINHLTETEIKWLRIKTNKSFAEVLDRSERALFVAKKLPREFVTAGPEWLLTHSLSNKTFNLVEAHYHQFLVLQGYVWSSKGVSDHVHMAEIARSNGRMALDITADSEVAVMAINHLLTLASLKQTTSTSVEVYTASHTSLVQAHDWARDNWRQVRKLSSRHCVLPNTAPSRNDVGRWRTLLTWVVKKQLGMGVRTRKDKNKNVIGCTFGATGKSIWKTLGVDIPAYTQWLLGDKSITLSTSPCVVVPCGLCGDNARPVKCVYQGGVARCMLKSSENSEKHRDTTSPLDVGLATSFEDRVAGGEKVSASCALMLTNDQPLEEEEEETKTDASLVDRLLMYIGFVDGVRTKEALVLGDMLAAIATNEPLSPAEQVRVKHEFQLDMQDIRTWKSAGNITKPLLRFAGQVGFKLSSKLTKRRDVQSRVYLIEQ